MMPFPATFDLTTLDGSNGYTIPGTASFLQMGYSASSVGDINGDGLGDFILSAQGLNEYNSYRGGAYVVFGRSGLTGAAQFDLNTLDGTNGFRITGEGYLDQVSRDVSSAGDVNGDGIDDLMLTAFNAGGGRGIVYVVFGRDAAAGESFGSNLNLGGLDGADGYRIFGAAAGDRIGTQLAAAGDLNGDGIGDMIIGAPYAHQSGTYADGAAYVVFGRADGGDIDLATLDGTNGFAIAPSAPEQQAGRSVSGIGDINGDGMDDIAVGAWRGNLAYVIYGQSGAYAAEVSLAGLPAAQGFEIVGVNVGRLGGSISAAGDFNNDGVADFVIGSEGAVLNGHVYNGAAYVVFGRAAGGFGATLDLTTLDGTNGFVIAGAQNFDGVGAFVARTDDVNADGIDDILLAASGAPNGGYNGAAYVIFGRNGSGAALLDLAGLDGTQGFKITGPLAALREIQTITGAGDTDGDGLADILVSTGSAGGYAGAAYLIYGFTDGITSAGTALADNTNGGAGRDSLSGGLGNDILHGLGGHDLLDGGDLSDQLFGGLGADSLIGGGGGDLLYGEEGDDAIDGGDGADKLFGGDGQDTLVGGLGNDRMDGGDDNDSLNGGDGNDTLDGGAGHDTLTGGLGNDVYILGANDYDDVVEAADGGYDIIRAARELTMADNVEGAELTGSDHVGVYGNSLSNNIQGNSGENMLQGNGGVDTLNGNDGDDRIVGGVGNDLLRGGTGRDEFFIFQESIGRPTLETDQIYDFSTAEGDLIYLSAIDAIAGGSDDAFTYVGTTFTRHAGEMTLSFAGGVTTLKLDQNGDGKADYQLRINGDVTGDSAGWVL